MRRPEKFLRNTLDLRLDQMPYKCDPCVYDLLSEIDKNKSEIEQYFEKHPNAKNKIMSLNRVENYTVNSALSYLNIDDSNESIDIKPSALKNEDENQHEFKLMSRVKKYKDACLYIYKKAHGLKADEFDTNEEVYLDDRLMLKTHNFFRTEAEIGNNVPSHRFRNEHDPDIKMQNAWFKPVPGELVAPRMQFLFFNFYNEWFDDHPVIKASKFLLEYYRIQPHLDGNKRTAILGMNFILEKAGYPGIYFDVEQKQDLIDSLEEGMLSRDVSSLVSLVSSNILNSQKEIMKDIVSYRIEKFEEFVESKE